MLAHSLLIKSYKIIPAAEGWRQCVDIWKLLQAISKMIQNSTPKLDPTSQPWWKANTVCYIMQESKPGNHIYTYSMWSYFAAAHKNNMNSVLLSYSDITRTSIKVIVQFQKYEINIVSDLIMCVLLQLH